MESKKADTIVTIPEFNHSSIDSILEINKNIIKILTLYQNNGWGFSPEQKIYQQRLRTNLTFLATLADCLIKQDKQEARSNPKKQVSELNKDSNGNIAMNNRMGNLQMQESIVDITKSRTDIMATLPPPTMILVGDLNSKPNPKTYHPVPPLVGQNPARELQPCGYTLVNPKLSRELMTNRSLQAGFKLAQEKKPTKLSSIMEQSSDISDGEYQVGMDAIDSDEDDVDVERNCSGNINDEIRVEYGSVGDNPIWSNGLADNNGFLFGSDPATFEDLFL